MQIYSGGQEVTQKVRQEYFTLMTPISDSGEQFCILNDI